MPKARRKSELTQQEFLRSAMRRLDMTRAEFAARIGANPRRLKNWLLPDDSPGMRPLDPVVRTFVREIVEREGKTTGDATDRTP